MTQFQRKRQEEVLKRFTDRYSMAASSALNAVEEEAIGAVVGANGYTTVAQADQLLAVLDLKPATWLLDIGAGRGWPGLYLSERSGCRAVVTDVPRPAIVTAQSRALDLGLHHRCHVALASGSALPFRSASFEAIVHTDTL
jgi:ubiquinone/menaquinone biosynthesis C-methylase UbiE